MPALLLHPPPLLLSPEISPLAESSRSSTCFIIVSYAHDISFGLIEAKKNPEVCARSVRLPVFVGEIYSPFHQSGEGRERGPPPQKKSCFSALLLFFDRADGCQQQRRPPLPPSRVFFAKAANTPRDPGENFFGWWCLESFQFKGAATLPSI